MYSYFSDPPVTATTSGGSSSNGLPPPVQPFDPLPVEGGTPDYDPYYTNCAFPLEAGFVCVTVEWSSSHPAENTLTFTTYASPNKEEVDDLSNSALFGGRGNISEISGDGRYKYIQWGPFPYCTKIYWRVIARNNYHLEAVGDTWSFTTTCVPLLPPIWYLLLD